VPTETGSNIGVSALSEKALDLLDVTGVDIDHSIESTGTGRGLLFEQVLTILLKPTQLSGSGLLEALRSRLTGLHLGHVVFTFSIDLPVEGQGLPESSDGTADVGSGDVGSGFA